MKRSSSGDSGWASIIRSVQTPLGFFALVVLVGEAILGALAVRATGRDFTLLVAGMLVILVLLILSVFLTARNDSAVTHAVASHSPRRPTTRKYDVFLSSVLAGFAGDARLLQEKRTALAIVKCLEQDCGFVVYYAGRDVQSVNDFDGSHLGAKRDIAALSDSRYFVLLYPERVTSSVLFETGFALNHCEASIDFVRDRQHLPYLMRRLPEAVPGVRTFTYEDAEGILRVLKRHRRDLFLEIARPPEWPTNHGPQPTPKEGAAEP
jgi:hypothetical protein